MSEYPIPAQLILDAVSATRPETQKRLLRTVWKDGIDLDAPNFDALRFAEVIAAPYQSENTRLIEALEHIANDGMDARQCMEMARAAVAQAKEPPCSTP